MNRKRLRRSLIAAVAVFITALGAVLFGTPAAGNLWWLATGRGFILPEESSLFTFQVTEMNTGSGEWWLYAEDSHYFYAQGDREGVVYIAFPRSRTAECPLFQRHDWTTWCDQIRRLHQSK